ncbi:MAG: DUF2474 family protein [Hyphomicrobium sp.]
MSDNDRAAGPGADKPLAGRLLWFAGLWLASVAALAVVAYAIRRALGL